VLVVDDREGVREVLRQELSDLGHRVWEASDGREALDLIRRCAFDVVVSDVRMPRLDGLGLARELGGSPPALVLFSAYADVPTAVEAMRAGAIDFVTMPIAPEALARRIEGHIASRLRGPDAPTLVGAHPTMVELRARVGRVARREASVLITGESGVGKEVVAREIHRRSARAAGPFVAVNCCALPESLLESELFGHERGAFTGASSRRRGRFELASGGTLFLDEIGDTPAATQAKLLRVLERHEFERVGGSETLAVDVRVLAATNRDLAQLRRELRFREDLFHRLAVFPIHVPPLRGRESDIPLLIEELSGRKGAGLRFTETALERMRSHPWPGNVRELANVLERVAMLCEPGNLATLEKVEQALDAEGREEPRGRARFEREERTRLEELLSEHRFNVSAVARRLGTSRGALRYRLRKYGLA
jgi:DNA-binding NtrC family response regulator